MPKALVTGASGFIGSHLVQLLAEKGWSVTCLLRPTSRKEKLRRLPVHIVSGNLEDQSLLEKAAAGQKFVFHLAGRIRSARKDVYERVNHLFTRNLARACLKNSADLERFVYVSSIAAAGPSPPGIIKDESFPPAPASEYGRSKLRGEKALEEFRGKYPFTIIRPPNVYGPGQQETEMLIRLIKKKMVPVLRSGEKKTSLIYISDLVHGLVTAASLSRTVDKVYYLTDGRQYSWRELIFAVKDIILEKGLFFPLGEPLILGAAAATDFLKQTGLFSTMFGLRAWKTMTRTPWLFSSARAEKEFGFRATFNLMDGLKQTILPEKEYN
ncbi:MAG: NAD-dependent epimerase/dehydratase family protein [Candidatus Aminicenantes bacterium]|nr:NAD-dependent epimerase/dehydratase family protein [Candidatus Aminicenantes bacterium]